MWLSSLDILVWARNALCDPKKQWVAEGVSSPDE